ncbi:unnamed protein product, partial [Mesorhabditis belari]|uniref:Golgin-84 n=1 Tax=Mesorhabditis belari TaxID=2138241 RepID=A0AAF3F5M9_9BILA
MSWLSKVTDMAGRAEEMLNRLDQSAGEVIQHTVDKVEQVRTSSSRTASQQQLNRSEVAIPITEEVGTKVPSQTHSEYHTTGRDYRKAHGGDPSTSRPPRDDELMAMLSEEPGHRSKSHGVVEGLNIQHDAPRPTKVAPVETPSRRSSTHSLASLAASETADHSGMKTQLLAKDSQITMLRNKLGEAERKLEKRNEELWDMKREKETLEGELAKRRSEPQESIEELRLARQKAIEAREAVAAESVQLRKRLAALEEDNSTMHDQLRLAKFNLSENKREFDEYKEKAAKILHAKEKLVESLKQGSATPDSMVIPAELEELRVERDMSRADLESCQLQLYNLRSEMDEQESRTREQQRELSDERRLLTEERAQWSATLHMLNEKLECARVEHEFARAEMRRQEAEYHKTFEKKDQELRQAVEEARLRRREEEYRVGHGPGDMAAAEKLLQKQAELEQALRDNQVLTLRLERLQKNSQEVSVNLGDAVSQPTLRGALPVQNQHARHALNAVDTVCFKFVTAIRNYPAARLSAAIYFVVMHLWLFFIIMTYTPEAHNELSFPVPGKATLGG